MAVSGAAGPSSLEGHPAGTVYVSSALFDSKNLNFKIQNGLKKVEKSSLLFDTHFYKFSGSRDEVREQTLNKAFLHVLSLIKN
nr:hypothetical protein [Treponema sp. OMZ 790]